MAVAASGSASGSAKIRLEGEEAAAAEEAAEAEKEAAEAALFDST